MPTDDGPPLCGVTRTGATGIEWICVRPVHAKTYRRRVGDHRHAAGAQVEDTRPDADRHYYVPRWPHRPPLEDT